MPQVIFFGTGSFSIPALRAISADVVLVVTQPDRPSGRRMRPRPSAVKLVAHELGIPVEAPEKSRSPEFVDHLRRLDADALVVASYGQILSTSVLESARRGGINLHGSILPKYRGAAPIQRSVLDGETETGVTLMQMDKGMDTGDVIEIRRTRIDPNETYGELQERLSEIAAVQISEWLPKIVSGDYPRSPQEGSQATTAPKVDRGEAELCFSRDVASEYNRYRAFTPNPGAWISTSAGSLKISQARLSDCSTEPGCVCSTSPSLVVGFKGGAIELIEVQPEGKRKMAGRDYANGARLKQGSRLI